jgi:hypothetical protein
MKSLQDRGQGRIVGVWFLFCLTRVGPQGADSVFGPGKDIITGSQSFICNSKI